MAILSGINITKCLVQAEGVIAAGARAGVMLNINDQVMSIDTSFGIAPLDITTVADKTRRTLDGIQDFSLNLSCLVDRRANGAADGDEGSAYSLLFEGDRRATFEFAYLVDASAGSIAVGHTSMRITDSGLSRDQQGNLMFRVTLASAGGDPTYGDALGDDGTVS